MFNSVLYVRDICVQRNIPISQLERECGFSNGYLNPKKMSKIPYDRARLIAEYLGITITEILTGEKEEKAPTNNGGRKIDLQEVDVGFYGEFVELSEDDKETVRDMVRVMRDRRSKKG